MPDRHLHIISFDIPYPPTYGGVIDVYCKIKALHAAGVKIHLHCFEYHRQPAPELDELCEEVRYYPRLTGIRSMLSREPYIVRSRRSDNLLKRLMEDDYPILFEGLHSCSYLGVPELRHRYKIYRESNIEHHYYFHLSKAEKNPWRKAFFFISGMKLMAFEKILRHSDLMLTVSREDHDYLSGRFHGYNIEYLPSFHHDDELSCIPGKGSYALYQGNLSVAENRKAAEFLITEVFADTDIPLVIAGMNPSDRLIRLAERSRNVRVVANPSVEAMTGLIRDAHINILVTFQATGLKLKLLNALFKGRFCLVNRAMLAGTELSELCFIADGAVALREQVQALMTTDFTADIIRKRSENLEKWHSNTANCKRLLELIPC